MSQIRRRIVVLLSGFCGLLVLSLPAAGLARDKPFEASGEKDVKPIVFPTSLKKKLAADKEGIIVLPQFPTSGRTTICRPVSVLSDDFMVVSGEGTSFSKEQIYPSRCHRSFDCAISGEDNGSFLSLHCTEDPNRWDAGGVIQLGDDTYFAGAPSGRKKTSGDTEFWAGLVAGIDCAQTGLPFNSKSSKASPSQQIDAVSKSHWIGLKKSHWIGLKIVDDSVFRLDPSEDIVEAGIAVETDTELFAQMRERVGRDFANDFERNLAALLTLARYTADLFGAVSTLYARDAGVAFKLNRLFFYPQDDPWSPFADVEDRTEKGGLVLEELRQYWLANRRNERRSVVHFLSGKDFRGGGLPGHWVTVEGNRIIRPTQESLDSLGLTVEDMDQENYGRIWRHRGSLCEPEFGYSAYEVSANSQLGPAHYNVIHENPLSPLLYVAAHEMGHNLSSVHTSCYNPPIDQCGGCEPLRPNLAEDGEEGSLMSYCPITLAQNPGPVRDQMRLALQWALGRQGQCPIRVLENHRPTIDRGGIAADGLAGAETRLTLTSRDADQGQQLFQIWDFGDGSPVVEIRCDSGRACEVEHVFQRAGFQNVHVTVTDERDGFARRSQRILIGRDLNHPPHAQIIGASQPPQAGSSAVFTLWNASDEDNDILRVTWQMGDPRGTTYTRYFDGNTAFPFQPEIRHTYRAAGRYTIRAIVNDGTAETVFSNEFDVAP